MRASVLVLCASALVLLGISSGVPLSGGSGVWAVDQVDNCVAETPYVSFVDVVSDDKRVGIGGLNANGEPESVIKIQVGSRSVPSALYARFSAKNGVVLDVTEWFHLPGSSVYIMNKLLTAMEPGGSYTIQLLRFTDLAGGVTEITDFSRFGLSDNFYVADSKPQLAPQLMSLAWDVGSSGIDVRNQDVPVTFTFRVALGTPKLSNGQPNLAVGPYVQQSNADVPLVGLGKFTFTFACTADPSVPPLTFTATNSTYDSVNKWFTGTVTRVIARGTRACTYQLANPMILSDSSIFSMRFPTELNPADYPNLGTTSFTVGSRSDTTAPQLTPPVTFTVVNSTYAAGVANTTFGSRVVYVWFRASDPIASGQSTSGVDTIAFAGAFSTGLVTNGLVTSAHLVDAATGEYAFPIVLPRGFPPATWSFTSAITVTDRAQNTFTVSSDAAFTVACPAAEPEEATQWWRRTWALALVITLPVVALAVAIVACVVCRRMGGVSHVSSSGAAAGTAAGGTSTGTGTGTAGTAGTGGNEMTAVVVVHPTAAAAAP